MHTRKLRRLSAWICAAVLAVPALVRADGMADAVKAIPSDAVGFLSVGSAQDLDGKIMKLVQTLGLAPAMPASPIDLYKEYTGITDGFDAAGSLSIVMFQPANMEPESVQQAIVVMVPTTDADAMYTGLGATADADGVHEMQRFGGTFYLATHGKHVCVSPSKDLLKKLDSATGSITDRMNESSRNNLAKQDIALWFDVQKIGELFKPVIEQFVETAQGAAAPGSFAAVQSKSMKENIDMLMKGLDTFQTGLALSPKGVNLSVHMTAVKETKLATFIKDTPTTDKSLLTGLPAENYVFTGGQLWGKPSAQQTVDNLDAMLNADEVKGECNADKLAIVQTELKKLITGLNGYAFSISALPESPAGLIGMTVVGEVDDAAAWLKSFGDLVNAGKETPNDEETQEALKNLTYNGEAGKVEDVNVQTLVFDAAKAGDMDPDDVDEMTKILGSDGVMFRMAAVSDKHVVIAFGGGEARFADVVKTAKAGTAPLSDDTGIEKVRGDLPKSHNSELYFAGDTLFKLVQSINKAVGDGPLPIRMAEVNAPIAVVGTSSGVNSEVDLYLPMEMIVAVKDTILSAVGGMMMDQGAPQDDDTL